MKTFYTINLGCRVNLFETNAVTYQLVQKGFKQVNNINKANVVLINTCTVTNKADAKSRNMISKAKHAKLKPIVIVMGCFSQLNQQWCKDKADIVIGTKYRNKIVEYLAKYLNDKKPICKINKDINKFEEFGCFKHLNNTRAVLKIQDGCDFYCSYCEIPYARGQKRSMPHKHILSLIKDYVKYGYKEIVITGVNTSEYKDGNYTFLDLLIDINKISGKFRARLSSLEPFQMSEKMIDIFASNKDRWANQLHLCLQNANNEILHAMNRRYTIEQYISFVKYIRSKMPNIAITTDYIVGFGNETQKQFEDGLKNLKKLNFANMNVFIYSRRHGTVADRQFKKDISPLTCRDRYNKVVDLKNKCQYNYIKTFVGKTLEVLVEKSKTPLMHGYSSEFVKVLFNSSKNLRNKLVKVKIQQVKQDGQNYYLFGQKI
ncbi:MAG: tRNA (N(6)-L-threonylcarbamoyladenosine(37)-C(2))-methylthiotransferase MtaB [Mycoplasmoidaceae bacterium]